MYPEQVVEERERGEESREHPVLFNESFNNCGNNNKNKYNYLHDSEHEDWQSEWVLLEAWQIVNNNQ